MTVMRMKSKWLYSCFAYLLVVSVYAQLDESNSAPIVLPDVLKTVQGKAVHSVSQWESERRGEVLELFEDNVYGQMPELYDKISFRVTNEQPGVMEGRARLKQLTITVWRTGKSLDIHLILFVPDNRKRVPVFVLINNREKDNTDPERMNKSGFWPAEMVIDSGYAIAAFHVSDAAPDDKEAFQDGVLQLYPDQLTAANGMKAIGAWAWAASRVMDYLQKDKDIDAGKVYLVGHSRGGKAALWAGAEDRRFAMVFASCSGNTGAALSRRPVGESVEAINKAFPHWFSDNYKKFNNDVDALPVDQHMLIALMAPRPIYTTSATEDLWADPLGSYMSICEAQRVYALYGMHSGLTHDPPPPNTPIINSILGYHIREGIHNLTPYDWQNFIQFANHHYPLK